MRHARLQPSAAKRWTRCPGSVSACAGLPDRPTEYSDQGIACHWLLARGLRVGSVRNCVGRPYTWQGAGEEERRSWTFTEEEVEWVERVLAFIQRSWPEAARRAEMLSPVGDAFGYSEDFWGTADVVVFQPGPVSCLTVLDAKFGFQSVAAVENEQLLCYAIGLAKKYDWQYDVYNLVIAQPRDEEHPFRSWVLSRAELMRERDRLQLLVERALDPHAPRMPDEVACEGCPFAGSCPELQEHALARAKAEFDVAGASGEDLSRVLRVAPLAEQAIAAARQEALRRLQAGLDVPGWKLGLSKRHRKWRDEKEAEEALRMLGIEPFERTLLSPAKAEKAAHLGAKALDTLAPKPPGEPTLVRDTDPRPALPAEFKPVNESDNE